MFEQDLKRKPIRDFVFPIGSVVNKHFVLKGTAFFVGDQGTAITAAHVTEQLFHDENKEPYSNADPVGLFVGDEGRWEPVDILSYEPHPEEDVALLRMDGRFQSVCQFAPALENMGREYFLFGYPETVAHEIRSMALTAEEQQFGISPDLIQSRGHVRRRISRELHSGLYRGKAFYELNEVVGSCCSGAPIIALPHTGAKPFQVIGIYIGDTKGVPPVAYATRFDAVISWRPEMTERKLLMSLPATA